jgi:hypothetical protein
LNKFKVVGTPGRLLYHLQNTKGFNLKKLQYLVIILIILRYLMKQINYLIWTSKKKLIRF